MKKKESKKAPRPNHIPGISSPDSSAKNSEFHRIAVQHKEIFNHVLAKQPLEIHDTAMVCENVLFLISAALDIPKVKQNEEYCDVTHFLLAKGMKTLWSVRSLLLCGSPHDAMILGRTLAETNITMQYLVAQDIKERMDRFRQYIHIDRSKNLYKHKSAKSEPSLNRKLETQALEERTRLIAKYGKSFLDHWSGLGSIESVFKAMQKIEHYISHYSTSSLLIHPSYLSRFQYQRKLNEAPSWEPTFKHLEGAALIAVSEILDLAKSYIMFHDVPNCKSLLVEIEWNLLSRFHHSGHPISHSKLKNLKPIERGKWGLIPKSWDK